MISASPQEAVRRLHRRSVTATTPVALLGVYGLVTRLAASHTVLPIWETLVLLLFPAAILTADLLLLRVREDSARHLLLGLAVPANIVLLVTALWVLFGPWWYGMPIILALAAKQPILALLTLAAMVARFFVIRSAFEVHRLLTAVGDRAGWATGLALSPLVLVAGLSPWLTIEYARVHPSPSAAAPAVAAARSIEACAERFAEAHAGTLPDDLQALGPSGSKCLDAALARGAVTGWSLSWRRGVLVVRERMRPLATYRSYMADTLGVLHRAGYARHDATASDAALSHVTAELAELRDCITRFRRVGAHQWPVSLWSLSPWRSSCYVLQNARWKVGGDSNVAEARARFNDAGSSYDEVYRYDFVPYAGAGGRVDSARIDARPVTYGVTGLSSYVLTPSGDIHATARDRPARATDGVPDRCESYAVGGCQIEDVTWLQVKPPADSAPVARLAPAWQATLAPRPPSSSVYRPPAPLVVFDSVVIATGQMGTSAHRVDGTRLWSRPGIAVVQGDAALGPAGSILVVDSLGVLHALDGRGRDVWQEAGTRTRFAPVRGANAVYIVGDRTLDAVSPRGAQLWQWGVDGLVSDAVAARDGGIYLEVSGDRLWLEHVTAAGRVDARAPRDSLRPCDGVQRPSLEACYGGVRVALAPDGSRRFVMVQHEMATQGRDDLLSVAQLGHDGTAFLTEEGVLRAMRPDFATAWRIPRGSDESGQRRAVVVGPWGEVVATSDDDVAAFDEHGTPLWTSRPSPNALYSPPVVDRRGVVYVVDTRWVLSAIRPPR